MPEAGRTVWVNGRLVPEREPAVSALDRGFTLGDGVFETMVARADRVFRLDDHLDRLRRGADLLGLSLPPPEALARAVGEALQANGDGAAVARLTVTRGVDTGRGLAIAGDADPTVVVRVTPHAGFASLLSGGLRVIISSVRRNEASPLSRVKSLSYTEGVMARREAALAHADDALLRNGRGDLACGASSNLFVVLDGVLVTPPEGDGVLAGVARRTVLEAAAAAGVEAAERSLPRDAAGAREAFLTNVVGGVMPIASIGGRAVGDACPGPVTLGLAAAYRAFFERETAP